MPDEELVRQHDHLALTTTQGVDYYLTELARRDADRQGARMVDLTAEIRTLTGNIQSMTGTIRMLTIVNVVLVAISLVLITKDVLKL
jgi:hypothetical protein